MIASTVPNGLPSQHVSMNGRGNIVVQVQGSGVNVSINRNQRYLRLTQFEARTKLQSESQNPTALLSACRQDVLPLIGRESAVEEYLRQ